MMLKPDFFIIGSPRSGTTLFRLMLTAHPKILVPQECPFILMAIQNNDSWVTPEKALSGLISINKFELLDINIQLLKEKLDIAKNFDYRFITDTLYRCYLAEKDVKKKLIGDKNNFYLNNISLLEKSYPDSKFIHIVRDGRDVICSYRRLQNINEKHSPQLPNSLYRASKKWVSDIEKISKSITEINTARILEIRYEDLVIEPEETLRTVCTFLKVSYNEEMLNFNAKLENYEKGMDAWKSMNQKPVDSSKVGIYQNSFFKEEKYIAQKIMKKILEKYNYKLDKIEFTFVQRLKNMLLWI